MDLMKVKVWACGEEHKPIMFDGDVICECGMKAIPYAQAEEIGLPILWKKIKELKEKAWKYDELCK